MKQLIEYLAQRGIHKKKAEESVQLFSKKYYDKGQIILNMGENTQFIYFIIKGVVRGFYVNEEGIDTTKCFSKENEWCGVYNMLRKQPSEYWIEALEPCEVIEISVRQVENLIEEVPAFQKLYTSLCAEAFMKIDERSSQFQKMSAKERYKLFMKENQDLLGRVKQEQIASYIGITPTSLSRIKKDL